MDQNGENERRFGDGDQVSKATFQMYYLNFVIILKNDLKKLQLVSLYA